MHFGGATGEKTIRRLTASLNQRFLKANPHNSSLSSDDALSAICHWQIS